MKHSATVFDSGRSPSRPGPGPMPEALLRALDVTIRRRIEGLLPGDYQSSAIGPGSELAQVRLYAVGDDVRRLDWNVTARTGEPHVRVDVAERVLTTWLLLDVSPSMVFGTAERRKADVAEGVALAVGHLATRRGGRLAVVTFGGPSSRMLPPRSGHGAIIGLLAELRHEQAARGFHEPTAAEALRRTAGTARRAAVFVVSDFRGEPSWRGPVAWAARRNHVVAVEIRDRREQAIPDVGKVWFVDPETGRQILVDTSNARVRAGFAERAEAERRALADELRSAGAGHVVLSTEGDWLREFAHFLRKPGVRR